MVEIVQRDHPVLRTIAEPIALEDIASPKIKKIISDMKKALNTEEDGVAIAAPQINQSLRIFVVSGKVLSPNYPDIDLNDCIPDDLVCINPEIIKLSKEKNNTPEGCLSIRYLYGNVVRSTKATIRAYNEKGIIFTRGGSGLLAQAFQHEIDHLNGILFSDTATDLEELPPAKTQKK